MELENWLRKNNCLQSDLANAIGVHLQTICRYINGQHDFSMYVAHAVSKFTNGEVSVEDLLSYEAKKNLENIRPWKSKQPHG